jgi:5'-methylthioadenosine nucleosidase
MLLRKNCLLTHNIFHRYSVLVPIVMDAEARPFVEHLKLEPIDGFFPAHTPFLAFDGIHAGVQVTVITFGKDKVYGTGVDNAGTVPASLATFLALAKFESSGTKVDLVLNAGTCGGFGRKSAGIGDVFLTTGVANHDRRIPIPGFDTYGIGKLETLDASTMANDLGYKTGICTTGNSLDKTDKDDEIMKTNDATVKDMEAAAVAWVCEMHNVKYLGVKVVTDIVDGSFPTQDEFMENLHSAAVSLQDALPKVLAYMADKNHEEL